MASAEAGSGTALTWRNWKALITGVYEPPVKVTDKFVLLAWNVPTAYCPRPPRVSPTLASSTTEDEVLVWLSVAVSEVLNGLEVTETLVQTWKR